MQKRARSAVSTRHGSSYNLGEVLNPRLVKVACPQCGASIRIDVKADVATCSYCNTSSFIHVPNRPEPPPPTGNAVVYRHIHVPAKAVRTVGVFVALMFLLPLVIVVITGIVVAGIILAVVVPLPSSKPASPAPAGMVPAKDDGAPGDACLEAVACCKAVMGAVPNQSANLRTCEALRALPDDACAKQAKTFRDSAKQMGRSCN